ncbi:hypothetical protein DS2_09197 [Catenovulum agarivorans DS-2]|uniref:Uncharacterized protein n=1 Tax=Catenovulum agarivorans DS-2 TaxID=1328313 RepID=W7QXU2_9ALTE|nr:hypothetical protein [Catenovulum agarivorans]EWH10110.1 hypothetical protein DS2_09197 [Catenovulum agarivorans DS-2]
MSTELKQVVQSMSQVSIPQEILNKVDMKNLLQGFSDDYKKLDDLKKARSQHEDRSMIGRWLNNGELENAQLDAAELQASFSKKLGQLMVISVAQSQQLHQQQVDLSGQQKIIKKQTEQLADNDENLKTQQLSLEQQNVKLENLVNEYFELKGLTQDGALQLIKIANEVKETKEYLANDFEIRMQEIERIRQNILIEQSELKSHQIQQLNIFADDAKQRLEDYRHLIDQTVKQASDQIRLTEQQLQLAMNTVEERIDETLLTSMGEQKQQLAEYDLGWRDNRDEILAVLNQCQNDSENAIQLQNSRLEELRDDNAQLQQKLNKQEQQNTQQLDVLHSLLDTLKTESEKRELYWQQRWKLMTSSIAGIATTLAAIIGYWAYMSYY